MAEDQTPLSQRRQYRRREIHIEEPKLRQMSEPEPQAADSAPVRLIAAMIAEEFMKAETQWQHNANH